MNKSVIRNLVYSRVAFFGAMAICIVLSQRGITDNQGLSYYGTTWQTFVPYALGFVLTAFFVFRATFGIENDDFQGKFLTVALRLVAVLMLGVLMTPYAISMDVYHIHVMISATLFIIELILAIWFTLYIRPDWINRALILLVLASGIVAYLSLNSTLRYMVQAQLAYELCFALMLLRSLKSMHMQVPSRGTHVNQVE